METKAVVASGEGMRERPKINIASNSSPYITSNKPLELSKIYIES